MYARGLLLLLDSTKHLSTVPNCIRECMCTLLLQDYKKHLLEVIPVENLPEMFGGLSRTKSFKVRGRVGERFECLYSCRKVVLLMPAPRPPLRSPPHFPPHTHFHTCRIVWGRGVTASRSRPSPGTRSRPAATQRARSRRTRPPIDNPVTLDNDSRPAPTQHASWRRKSPLVTTQCKSSHCPLVTLDDDSEPAST